MKKLFVVLVLALSLSLGINIIALGDPGSHSSQVRVFHLFHLWFL